MEDAITKISLVAWEMKDVVLNPPEVKEPGLPVPGMESAVAAKLLYSTTITYQLGTYPQYRGALSALGPRWREAPEL